MMMLGFLNELMIVYEYFGKIKNVLVEDRMFSHFRLVGRWGRRKCGKKIKIK